MSDPTRPQGGQDGRPAVTNDVHTSATPADAQPTQARSAPQAPAAGMNPYLPQPGPPGYQPATPQPGGFKRGFGLGAGAGIGLGAILLVFGVIGSIITAVAFAGIVTAAGGGVQTAGTATTRTVWGDDNATHTLWAVSISGPIMTDSSDGALLTTGTYGYEIAQTIDGLSADDADGLLLLINTPGGTITGAKAMADAVQRYQERTKHKVVAHIQGMSASGGMYAMAGADEIIADHGSMTGSIGVIFGPFQRFEGVTQLDGGLLGTGVTAEKIEEFYLTKGTGKDFGNPFRDLTEEERNVLMTGLQNEYDAFVSHVSTERDIPAQTIVNDLGAHLYDNKTALANGLIDSEMGVDAAYRHAAELNGVDAKDVKVVATAPPSFLDTLLGAEQRSFGQSVAAEEARVSASLCSSSPKILAYSGDVAQMCG